MIRLTILLSTLALTAQDPAADLKALRAKQPKIRIRDAAAQLGLSELELAQTFYEGRVTRLKQDVKQLLEGVQGLGEVMAISRNEAAVHERHGKYEQLKWNERSALVLGPDIDLRIFPSKWAYAIAIEQPAKPEARKSIQCFGADGEAIHKIYLTGKTDEKKYDALVAKLKDERPAPFVLDKNRPAPAVEKADQEVDAKGFLDAWSKMTDVHQFFGLLPKFGVTRPQALRLAEGRFTQSVGKEAITTLLETASREKVELIIFVPNPGIVQIHTGPVKDVQPMGSWINVLDPEFNLHLNRDLISRSWLVTKPTRKGTRTSLEIFDAKGGVIAHVFGKEENAAWLALLKKLAGPAAGTATARL